MEENAEFKKLPVDERCVHKLWKARVDGYEEAAKIFRTIDDEKSPEWNKFIGLVKKFVVDSNAVAQEKGLEATLIFVSRCGSAGKTAGDILSGIVNKCLSAPKAKTKELSNQIILMLVEVEKHELVIEELLKGMDHKNPKVVSACITVLTQSLREFGHKVIAVKALVKKVPALLSDRDKGVRDEAKQLTIEIYRWIGVALKPQLTTLPAVLLSELEGEFEKCTDKAEPTRYLKSQQEKQMAAAAAHLEEGTEDAADGEGEDEEVDPLDLIDPVDILSKLPKDFYDKLEAKKWQERKESMDALEELLKNPKLESGDYGDLVRALKKVITKDSNVVLVALATKNLAGLARGLEKRFQPYSAACVSSILEKFKEKKANVVTALREAIDALFLSISLETILEDVLEALNNKNPSVKAETAGFLARAFTKTQPTAINKKTLKALVTALLKTLNESDPTVRDNSAEAIGTCIKLVGEKNVSPYLVDLDPLKMAKVKECQEKAVIVVKIVGAKKERPATAPPKPSASTAAPRAESKPPTRPATASTAAKRPVSKKAGATSTASLGTKTTTALPTERELSPEEVDAKASELLTPDVISGLSDANWKTRLSASELFLGQIDGIEAKTGNSQTLLKTICKKPGLKDTNFQVVKLRLDIVKSIIEKLGVTTITVDAIINDVTEKLSDAKNSPNACVVLTSLAEATSLEYIVCKVLTYAFEQKSPKVQSESILWVNSAIKEFGFQVNPKLLIDDVKKGVQSVNPVVRGAGISLLGTMHLYMGNTLTMFFENEKPALKQQIQTEFDKNVGQKPPTPTRGVASKAAVNGGNDEESSDEKTQSNNINLADLLPRVDISSQITEALLAELSDKDWKTRNEGLTKLQDILNEAKLIKPTLGDLPPALVHRLHDSNAKIAQTTVTICQQLAEAMGPNCKQHIRVLFPGFLHGLGDGKSFLRSACIQCINTWGDQCGFKEFFEGEMIADSLKAGSPPFRIELWAWLAEQLPKLPTKSIQKEELVACLPQLYSNVTDRSAEVRKNANEAVLGFMIHLGYETMIKVLDKQKPTIKKDVQAALDKARPNLPVKPLPKSKQQAPLLDEPKAVKSGGASKAAAKTVVAGKQAAQPLTSRKKEEDIDTSPLLAVNKIKSQRLLDEQKLKVLKWSFTSPRPEFTELLRDQMTAANVNRNLMANMFHDDFRYHLKAIESLLEDLSENTQALICNLDLILKWISLRLYDTNPSVLLKGLEYLNTVFQLLRENKYVMAENEASCFIPHLLIKIGDPKDAVRNGVRILLRQICTVYAYSRVFPYIMEGLKSKNARLRTECLDELGYLIETYGINVCQPSPSVALKEIARQISDRDNTVRSAALNCVVQAYFLIEDKVYKMIGQLNEKDLSMLDERIKRAKKNRKTMPEIKIPTATVEPDYEEDIVQEDIQPEVVIEEPQSSSEGIDNIRKRIQLIRQSTYELATNSETAAGVPEPAQPKKKGPFGLDPNVVAEIERGWVRFEDMPKYTPKEFDLSYFDEPIKVIPVEGCASYPAERLEMLKNRHTVPALSNYTLSPLHSKTTSYTASRSVGQTNEPVVPKLAPSQMDPNILRILTGIGSPDSMTARASINELSDILESPNRQAVLRDYEEIYIQNITTQFKNLSQKPLEESKVVYQPMLASCFAFFTSKSLGKNVGIACLKNFMSVLLNLMADQKMASGDFSRVVNGVCLKTLDRSNFTNSNCALIRLLKETCSGSCLPKFIDLLMKCIWRNVKMLPERSDELDYDAVLYEAHDFMTTLPSTWWQQRPNDTPNRTVKTIVHNMAKIRGHAIVNHLSKIPDHSELRTYMLRVLKNLSKENPEMGPVPALGKCTTIEPDRLNASKQINETISNILKLFSQKDTCQDGLRELHELKIPPEASHLRFLNVLKLLYEDLESKSKTKNPEVDVMQYLKGASPTFRKFIEDGLAELDRNSGPPSNVSPVQIKDNKMTEVNNSNNNPPDPDYWLERLNNLMRKNADIDKKVRNDGIYSESAIVLDNKIADENLNMNNVPQKSSQLTSNMSEMKSNNRMELIQKFSQIRQQYQS